jgi:hypothetical protein
MAIIINYESNVLVNCTMRFLDVFVRPTLYHGSYGATYHSTDEPPVDAIKNGFFVKFQDYSPLIAGPTVPVGEMNGQITDLFYELALINMIQADVS